MRYKARKMTYLLCCFLLFSGVTLAHRWSAHRSSSHQLFLSDARLTDARSLQCWPHRRIDDVTICSCLLYALLTTVSTPTLVSATLALSNIGLTAWLTMILYALLYGMHTLTDEKLLLYFAAARYNISSFRSHFYRAAYLTLRMSNTHEPSIRILTWFPRLTAVL